MFVIILIYFCPFQILSLNSFPIRVMVESPFELVKSLGVATPQLTNVVSSIPLYISYSISVVILILSSSKYVGQIFPINKVERELYLSLEFRPNVHSDIVSL